jgi:hypothetical protein
MAQKADDNHTSSGQSTGSSATPGAAQAITLQQLVRPVALLPLDKFLPLDDAFAQASSRLGAASGLTARDLWQHARNRRLTVAARRILPDGTERVFIFRSAFWQHFVFRLSPDAVHSQVRLRGALEAILVPGPWHLFVGRRRFDRLYPTAAPSGSAAPAPAPRHAGGREREFDRERLLTEALIYTAVHGWPDHVDGDGGLAEKLAATTVKLPGRTTLHDIFDPIMNRIKAERDKLEKKKPRKPAR